MNEILCVDMDNVLVNFQAGISHLPAATVCEYENRLDEVHGIFALMDPMAGVVGAYHQLANQVPRKKKVPGYWRQYPNIAAAKKASHQQPCLFCF
jgi:hypothetical protein